MRKTEEVMFEFKESTKTINCSSVKPTNKYL